jgi:hypothetical protein
VTLSQQLKNRLCCLRQSADAFSAERFLNFLTVLNNRHLLQVGMKRTIGSPFGERNVVTKGSGLTTMSTFCHLLESLSKQIRPACFEQAAYSTMNRTLVQVECYLMKNQKTISI